MKVTVTGKERISGTSKKTGRAFDSVVVYVVFPAKGVTGLKTDNIWLDPNQYPLDSIKVNSDYDVDLDIRGWLLAFKPL